MRLASDRESGGRGKVDILERASKKNRGWIVGFWMFLSVVITSVGRNLGSGMYNIHSDRYEVRRKWDIHTNVGGYEGRWLGSVLYCRLPFDIEEQQKIVPDSEL